MDLHLKRQLWSGKYRRLEDHTEGPTSSPSQGPEKVRILVFIDRSVDAIWGHDLEL
jgi:hypothetical protein